MGSDGGHFDFQLAWQRANSTTTNDESLSMDLEKINGRLHDAASEDFQELESVRDMASLYGLPDELVVSTWAKIKSDPEREIRTYHECRFPSEASCELRHRIDVDPDIDDMHNSRPDAYKMGWSSACDKIAVVDAIFDALPFGATEEDFPANFAELREYAETEAERLRHDRRLTFLERRTWSDDSRCEYWTWQGREDCAEYACGYLNKADNDIPSDDLAKILRKHNSISEMIEVIAEHRQEKHVQSRGSISQSIQEYSQRLRANNAIENFISDNKKRGAI